ncbi:MAG: helix-hairpin-helix domain-containing protein [Chitinophagales bacterium]
MNEKLESIPGVGRIIAQYIRSLGFSKVSELKGQDPELLYQRICEYQGCHMDRCLLYVFRCAIYYASHNAHDPELLKWWNWKDSKLNKQGILGFENL